MDLEEFNMMSATADHDVPVDLRGNPLTIDQVKDMLRHDVAELSKLHSLKAVDDARRDRDGIHIPNRRLENLLGMWEQAHDLHWAWYRAMLDATTDRS